MEPVAPLAPLAEPAAVAGADVAVAVAGAAAGEELVPAPGHAFIVEHLTQVFIEKYLETTSMVRQRMELEAADQSRDWEVVAVALPPVATGGGYPPYCGRHMRSAWSLNERTQCAGLSACRPTPGAHSGHIADRQRVSMHVTCC